ncbi:MAG: hypothetical protein ACXV3S_07555 [Kineosporiaceae bacterium]
MTAEITDAYMNEMRAQFRQYSLVLLRKTARFAGDDNWPIIWEHGRRNFSLRAQEVMPIVCPISDDSDLAGMCILDVEPDEARRIMAGDPAVRAGLFTVEVHTCRGFPGDALST